ncbi:MAG: arsenite methyltransferase [Candidatus Omnitrophica bacterium]|nr:arsenite methyltransferase [Candidatus Omnitrophota bacterium]
MAGETDARKEKALTYLRYDMKRQAKEIKKIVRDGYANALSRNASCCSTASCCCGTGNTKEVSKKVGYSDSEISAVPDGANLGFGCGNPVALALLEKGDVVLDLGSGAGFDAFLAAQRVGRAGRVIGVDMTPEMIERAKGNARKGKYTNVEFRLGEIEKLPVEDESVDVIISNCVINLSPDKEAVFKEAFRVLKTGGRLMVSDLVLAKKLPEAIKESVEAYVGCFAGAIRKEEYLKLVKAAGFQEVKVISRSSYPVDAMLKELKNAEDAVISIKVSAVKK